MYRNNNEKRQIMANKIIAIDFDGTCVGNEFPEIGITIPHCIETLKKLIEQQNKLILYTMRSEKKLISAIEWFKENKIKLWGINNNPQQRSWSSSRKIFAHIYIDDLALGCPLTSDRKISKKDFVDWVKVEKMLKEKKILE